MVDSSTVKTLSFQYKGEDITGMYRDFVTEGSFHIALKVLIEGGLPEHLLKDFFQGKVKFVGDSKEGMYCESEEGMSDTEFETMMYYAVQMAIHDVNTDDSYEDLKTLYRNCSNEEYKNRDEYKNLVALFKIYSLEEIRDIVGYKYIKQWYKIISDPSEYQEENVAIHGAILTNGDIVVCDYQGHNELYEILYGLGYANSTCWTEEDLLIHISSGEISGGTTNYIKDPNLFSDTPCTEEQLLSIFKFKKHITGFYGENESTSLMLLEYTSETINNGGKYNNLCFLEKYYNFNLPKFSKKQFKDACIRTSPKLSMAGLLSSKFKVTDYPKAIKEIEADFEKFKNVVGSYTPYNSKEVKTGNELHIFYQEFLEGMNGVCHFWNNDFSKKEGTFSYSVSENQGDIVNGIKSELSLSYELETELHNIAKQLSTDLGSPVQIEFVINDNKVYIVQLRILKNNPSSSGVAYSDKDILCKGKSFSVGSYKGKKEDFLIVDSDCDSERLIGKKALIVREDVEFSHVLALSKAMGIPSMYNVGNFEFSDKISIYTDRIEGLILK